MKTWGIVLGWFLIAHGVAAQTTAEWLDQSATRKQYNEQQVVAWGTFLSVLKTGYSVVEGGLTSIREIKQGEFNLHDAFYTSLTSVNPRIAGMGEIVEIIALQAATIERVNLALSRYRAGGALGADDMTVVGNKLNAIVNAGTTDINTLIQILTAGKLQMTDDQRIACIRELDVAARERYGEAATCTDQTDVLSLQREEEATQVSVLKGLYGLQ